MQSGLISEQHAISMIRLKQTAWSTTYGYLLRALKISMTTSTDNAIVLAFALSNTRQSMLGNIRGSAGHCMWWVCPPKRCTNYSELPVYDRTLTVVQCRFYLQNADALEKLISAFESIHSVTTEAKLVNCNSAKSETVKEEGNLMNAEGKRSKTK